MSKNPPDLPKIFLRPYSDSPFFGLNRDAQNLLDVLERMVRRRKLPGAEVFFCGREGCVFNLAVMRIGKDSKIDPHVVRSISGHEVIAEIKLAEEDFYLEQKLTQQEQTLHDGSLDRSFGDG